MIKQCFIALVVQYGATAAHAESLWLEVETAYLSPDRFFHDLDHLNFLYSQLHPLQELFEDWPTAFFSLVYHDVVYDVEQHMVYNNNEEGSAVFAERHLKTFPFPADKIDKCKQQILATQKHTATDDNDTDLITDADLSILGQPWRVYEVYKNNIRKEYAVYADSIYKTGRRKVLQYFHQMNPLFKTKYFFDAYEAKAKENIEKEIMALQG